MAQAKTEQKKDRVDEIIATGAHKGVLTHDELNKTLTDEEMEPGQLEKILNELEKRTVKVVEHLPDELEPDAKALAEGGGHSPNRSLFPIICRTTSTSTTR